VDLTNITTLTYPDLSVNTRAFKDATLTAGHCVLALHKVVSAMYGPPNRYDYVVAAITLRGLYIGRILIDNNEEDINNGNDSNNVPVLSNLPPAYTNTSLTLDDSGIIVDPEYKTLRVMYRYGGRHIRSEEIFTAVLDGLTTLAPYSERSNECASMVGVSGSGDVDFYVTSTNPGVRFSSCFVLKRASVLVILWLMAPSKRFGELDFSFEYLGVEVATGYVYMSRVPRVGRGNSTVGITSS